MSSVKREGTPLRSVTPPRKRFKQSESHSSTKIKVETTEYGSEWADWPAPRQQMKEARAFIMDIIENRRSVLIVPDKDADGLSAGTLLYQTLVHLGLEPSRISVHHLSKGTNVHSDAERDKMAVFGADKIVVLDQGSRPGRAILPSLEEDEKRVLIIDHHMSDEWPENSQVLTACHTSPIATASLLTYMMLRELHPSVIEQESWRAIVGVVGDLGTTVAKWGVPPWPSELGDVTKRVGAKSISDAVAGINAPRRTAEYNVPKAWGIILDAKSPSQIASNAFLKLCKLDVQAETEKWARTPPRFSEDGRVAVVTVDTGFQVHPVIATRWAGTLGKKSKKLIMIMCANTSFNPDPAKISFSCRIASGLRSLPDDERPNLIALLNEYADSIEGFRERVGGDYARGHKEATGGIIAKTEFALLLQAMGVPSADSPRKPPTPKGTKRKVLDPTQTTGIKDFFKTLPPKEPTVKSEIK
ncbi:single-stranded-DNA-specific exonuclease, partial [Tremellales sp. Uapishka_1]